MGIEDTDVPANSAEPGPFTVDDLPSPTARWTVSRKLEVVHAVTSGIVPLDAVLQRYNMTEREFRIWEKGLEKAGRSGLMVTKLQLWRRNNRTEL